MLAPHVQFVAETLPTGYLAAPRTLPHARHLFGTRADTQPDSNATIRHITERLGPIAHLQQVHGTRLAYAGTSGLIPEADAVYTDQPGLWLAVKTADCVPVLVSSPHAVAAIHAGWRGLKDEIIPHTLRHLTHEFGLTPDDLHVAIGPCISQKNYEVEGHFMEYFKPRYASFFGPGQDDDHMQMDCVAIARAQALEAGVLDMHIHTLGRCTFAEPAVFHSHRRDGAPGGRQISLIQRR